MVRTRNALFTPSVLLRNARRIDKSTRSPVSRISRAETRHRNLGDFNARKDGSGGARARERAPRRHRLDPSDSASLFSYCYEVVAVVIVNYKIAARGIMHPNGSDAPRRLSRRRGGGRREIDPRGFSYHRHQIPRRRSSAVKNEAEEARKEIECRLGGSDFRRSVTRDKKRGRAAPRKNGAPIKII